MSELRKRAAAVAILMLAAACGSSDRGAAQGQTQTTPPAIREQLGSVPSDTDAGAAASLSAAFRGAAAKALPAVVFIQVEKEAGEEMQQIPEPFRRFFGIPPDGEELPPNIGAGSGFILDAEGHIITNNHVVEGAEQVLVRMVDGREYTAKVLGNDDQTDVAVIKIEPRNGERLPTSQLASSSALQVGDWVLALGSPLELEFTVTAGIVSAKGRQLGGDPSSLQAFIQTDAAINPGNSGGPLVDLQGRVVGINSAIFGGPRFVGYGFAIPIDLAKKAVQDILRYGHVRRPMIGVSIQRVSEADAEVYGLPEIRGAEVVSITPDTPAARAGLRIGDVILALDGDPINASTDLTTGLAQHQPGDDVTLTVWRDRKSRQMEVELAEFERGRTAEERPSDRQELETRLGFRVEALTPELARELELEVSQGVVISQVTPLSPAAIAGVRPGLLLSAINGQQVSSVSDVERAARELQAGSVVSLRLRARDTGELIINYRARR
jgi:serine protease Do